ncbi:isochorismate synthase [Pseudonocardiaceae bacterium YIM PH 21723]|nr:isochorismate synthase [Pseudonocardiaceae bacterium YIM PH 21723]
MTSHIAHSLRPVTDDYQTGGFFFSSPSGVLLADSLGESLTGQRIPTGALAVGALPFVDPASSEATVPARLSIPDGVRRAEPLHIRPLPPHPGTGTHWIDQHTDSDAYLTGVSRALELMADGTLSKVVLARTLELTAAEPIDLRRVLGALAARDPHGYTFATDVGGRTLIGTSPELLIRKTGDSVVSNPLAGSRPRSADPESDGRNATELLASAKDRAEHAHVVTAVADALAPFCLNLTVPSGPELLPTPAMWHLSTRITGELRADVTSLELASALHPTPAVCGVPMTTARTVISELEPFARDYYTGLVGWMDEHGDGEWIIALRCGEVHDRTLRLYAGAGIVPGSTPESELAETSAKFRTFLGALGIQEAR